MAAELPVVIAGSICTQGMTKTLMMVDRAGAKAYGIVQHILHTSVAAHHDSWEGEWGWQA
jgi:hypothetical protein